VPRNQLQGWWAEAVQKLVDGDIAERRIRPTK
jgi:hypothetical protein